MLKKFEKAKRYLIAGSFLSHCTRFVCNIIKRCRKKADYILGFLIRKIVFRWGNIQNNKILVRTFDGRYSCNPKYVVEEILRQKLPVNIVWVVPAKGKIKKSGFPEGIRLVRSGSYTMYREMASSKVWIDNALNCVWEGMPKKKGQIYINTWHGSMGIKRLSGNRIWMRRAKRCNRVTDYCIANSQFEEDVYKSTFWKKVPCLQYGHARNDILFLQNLHRQLKESICDSLHVDEAKKIALYAPTFRDDKSIEWLNIDLEHLKNTLEIRFGGEWVIFLRMHFKDKKRAKKKYRDLEYVVDVSGYGDMQEILAIADVGITDYSSWAYDYILTKRPLFIYAPDLEKYDQNRGFYYPLDTTPFSIAVDNLELEENILNFKEQEYLRRIDLFLQEKGCVEDGHACERIVSLIKKMVGVDCDEETSKVSVPI